MLAMGEAIIIRVEIPCRLDFVWILFYGCFMEFCAERGADMRVRGADMRLFVFASISALIVAFSATQAPAADVGFCNAYVDYAMSTAQKAKDLKCPFDFNSPMWGASAAGRRRFCREALPETVTNDWNEIGSEWTKCAQCNEYANKAVAASHAYEKYDCGQDYFNPRWQYQPEGHFNWCMGLSGNDAAMWLPDSAVSRETKAREDEINACKQRNALEINVCNAFMAKTNGAWQLLYANRCPLHGDEPWGSNVDFPDARFGWCMQQLVRRNDTHEVDKIADDILAEVPLCKATIADRAAKKKRTSTSQGLKLRNSGTSNLTGGSSSKKGAASGKSLNSGSQARVRSSQTGRYKPRVIGPGLLEDSNSLGMQGPAATGTPASRAAPSLHFRTYH